jgi:hypothetical protein
MLNDGNIVEDYDASASNEAKPLMVSNPNLTLDPNGMPTGDLLIPQIGINSNPGTEWHSVYIDFFNVAKGMPWNEDDQRLYRAMTLVHELAHIFAVESGNPDNPFNKNDKDDAAQQFKNQLSIFLNCFT